MVSPVRSYFRMGLYLPVHFGEEVVQFFGSSHVVRGIRAKIAFSGNLSVAQVNDPAAAEGGFLVVGHHDDALSVAVEFREHVKHRVGITRIERAGRSPSLRAIKEAS